MKPGRRSITRSFQWRRPFSPSANLAIFHRLSQSLSHSTRSHIGIGHGAATATMFSGHCSRLSCSEGSGQMAAFHQPKRPPHLRGLLRRPDEASIRAPDASATPRRRDSTKRRLIQPPACLAQNRAPRNSWPSAVRGARCCGASARYKCRTTSHQRPDCERRRIRSRRQRRSLSAAAGDGCPPLRRELFSNSVFVAIMTNGSARRDGPIN